MQVGGGESVLQAGRHHLLRQCHVQWLSSPLITTVIGRLWPIRLPALRRLSCLWLPVLSCAGLLLRQLLAAGAVALPGWRRTTQPILRAVHSVIVGVGDGIYQQARIQTGAGE